MIKHSYYGIAVTVLEAGGKLIAGLVFLVALLWLAGCTPSPTVPEPPRELQITDEYPFGTNTSLVDSRHWSTLWDNAVEIYSKEDMRLERYVLSANISWENLESYYSQRLAEKGGWEEDKAITFGESATAWSFGFRKDNYFIALVGLQSEYEENGFVPVNLVTNLGE